ncbi:MAG: amylo-alpha-1,6-glucosidase [Candidatus Limnocylindrales bacterium]
MSDPAPMAGAPHDADRPTRRSSLRVPGRTPWWLLLGLLAGLIAVIVLAYAGVAFLRAPTPTATSPSAELVPQADLDRRWGTYLSEREWGTPREAVDGDGWGLTWERAIATDYLYGEDGIGGVSDQADEFRLGWAFWDGSEEHVTERFMGYTNPRGPAGEEILDDRVFHENGPTHAYTRMTYLYPLEERYFTIELETARMDSSTMTLVATVTNTTSDPRTIDVVFKGWMAPGATVDPLDGGLVLRGADSVVAVIGQEPSEWQISANKSALDENLRAEGLTEDQGGHIGALAYRLELPGGGVSVIRLGMSEASAAAEPANGLASDAATEAETVAITAARDVLVRSDAVIDARHDEAATLFGGRVTRHEGLFRQALMGLMWSESHYRWDGASTVNPSWAGRGDARDVLIMPDKWEYPWLASWDTAFHAVTAALADPLVAQGQLRFVLSDRWQQPDGHIPCGEWVMDAECPPVFAWAAARVYEISRDRAFLEEVYPALQRSYDYWWSHNQVGDALFTGGFLGMDNLPRSASPQPQADATAWMALFARDMAGIASELRDTETSERYFSERGRIQEQINAQLWDENSGFYYDLNSSGAFITHKSYSGLVPLIAGVVPPERLPQLLDAVRDEDQFMSVGGIRSLSAASSLFKPGNAGKGVSSNWLGPVWLPINYLIVEALYDIDPALAADIRERVVNNVERDWLATDRLYEFFNGDTGDGLGADFQTGWTALVANLILEGWPATPPP